MAADEDGQEAHPQAACTDSSNDAYQASAASERGVFGYFLSQLQKVTFSNTVRIV